MFRILIPNGTGGFEDFFEGEKWETVEEAQKEVDDFILEQDLAVRMGEIDKNEMFEKSKFKIIPVLTQQSMFSHLHS